LKNILFNRHIWRVGQCTTNRIKMFWREETQLLHKICSAVILELVVWPVGEHKKKKGWFWTHFIRNRYNFISSFHNIDVSKIISLNEYTYTIYAFYVYDYYYCYDYSNLHTHSHECLKLKVKGKQISKRPPRRLFRVTEILISIFLLVH